MDTQDTGQRQTQQIDVRENRRGYQIDNPETLITLDTQDTGQKQKQQIDVRENRRGYQIDNPETLATLGTQDTGLRKTKQKQAKIASNFYNIVIVNNYLSPQASEHKKKDNDILLS